MILGNRCRTRPVMPRAPRVALQAALAPCHLLNVGRAKPGPGHRSALAARLRLRIRGCPPGAPQPQRATPATPGGPPPSKGALGAPAASHGGVHVASPAPPLAACSGSVPCGAGPPVCTRRRRPWSQRPVIIMVHDHGTATGSSRLSLSPHDSESEHARVRVALCYLS